MDTRTRPRQMQRQRRPHRDPRACRPGPEQGAVPPTTGTQDNAHYTCGCGHAFSAGVSTSVDCPRCGAGQAW